MAGAVDCFQERGREAAGGALVAVTFGCWALTLSCNELIGEKWSGGSAEVRGGLGYQKEVAGSPGRVGIDDGSHGYLQTPARNFAGLAAQSVWKQRDEGEEEWGFL
jgi:hypothetical protein